MKDISKTNENFNKDIDEVNHLETDETLVKGANKDAEELYNPDSEHETNSRGDVNDENLEKTKERQEKDKETQDRKDKVQKTAKAIQSATITTSVVLIATGAVVIGSDFLIKDPTITVNSIVIKENTLTYDVSVKNPEKMDLKIYAISKERVYSNDINSDQTYTYTFTGMEYDTDYRVTIIGDARNSPRSYYDKTFRTEVYVPGSDVYDISWDCHCMIDGYAYYKVYMRDDFNYWSNYKLVLTRNSVSHEFTIDPETSPAGKIDVISLDKGTYTLDLTCDSINPKDLSSGETMKNVILKTLSVGI
jgi:hypothetical protein